MKENLTEAIAYPDNIAYQPKSAETLLSGLDIKVNNCFLGFFIRNPVSALAPSFLAHINRAYPAVSHNPLHLVFCGLNYYRP